jgi:Abortive infection C-terminus
MAALSILEKRQLERLLQMGGGYVLNFSNRTFQEFVADSVSRDIYDARYAHGSGSKANLLRGFWKEEGSRMVGKLLANLLDYAESECGVSCDDKDLQACRKTVARLLQETPVPELDALKALSDERDFEVVAKAVREAIEANEPEAGLDRLHTFVIKYVRGLCERAGIAINREKALHSLFGEYVKYLQKKGVIESEMTLRILKSSISMLEAFNDVRNNQSLAHDNPILNYEEALLIFNHVASSIRFMRSIDRTVGSREAAEQAGQIVTVTDDDIPF